MPSDSAFLVRRSVEVAPDLTVEIRVPRETAELWVGDQVRTRLQPQRDRMLSAMSDGTAVRRVHDELRARGVARGRWVATFVGDRVDLDAVK